MPAEPAGDDTLLRSCPVCESAEIEISVERAGLPLFQNVVYPTAAAARDVERRPFGLGTCLACGFSFNAVFRPFDYDERYDNEVSSDYFRSYYQSIIAMLEQRFDLDTGSVYDIGCGNGEFLQMLCAAHPGLQGTGIDPSCDPCTKGNFALIRDIFRPAHFAQDARLVLCRHVLEHIEQPRQFLAGLGAASPSAPIYIEVPDLEWILRNNAFWDFCYEHCNYFTPDSLAMTARAAGFEVLDQGKAFGDQYLWLICRPGSSDALAPCSGTAAALRDYVSREQGLLAALQARAEQSGGLALWGMATKGVILSLLLGEGSVLGGVDMNPRKQGQFAAGSGAAIHSPEWLLGLPATQPVMAMNPNYLTEIRALAASIGAPQTIEVL